MKNVFSNKWLFNDTTINYKVVQIWPGLIVCKQVTVCPGHIWTTLYIYLCMCARMHTRAHTHQVLYPDLSMPSV
jgi:hypothetical protein